MTRNSSFSAKKQDFKGNTPRQSAINRERGSAIIWILVMVALFAALNYAVSQNSRTGENQISEQQANLAATEILDYAAAVKRAVQELMINGCSDTEISFENNAVAGYTNPNAPSDGSCHIFNSNGGGLTYLKPNKDWLDNSQISEDFWGENILVGHTCVKGVGSSEGANCGTDTIDNEELIIFIPYISETICTKINSKNNINNIPQDSGNLWESNPKFVGSYTQGANIGQVNIMEGKLFGCLEGGANPSSGTYNFYQVLIAR